MMLDILTYPDPRLKLKAEPVAEVTESTRQLIEDMFETMYASSGIGLAATQVNVQQRVFVTDLSGKGLEKMVFINPEITHQKGECTLEEGCLSFPGVYASVTRPEKITITALNEHGQAFEKQTQDYEARCILHELDHLNGIVYFDYLSPTKRKVLEQKMKKRLKTRF